MFFKKVVNYFRLLKLKKKVQKLLAKHVGNEAGYVMILFKISDTTIPNHAGYPIIALGLPFTQSERFVMSYSKLFSSMVCMPEKRVLWRYESDVKKGQNMYEASGFLIDTDGVKSRDVMEMSVWSPDKSGEKLLSILKQEAPAFANIILP